MFYNQLQTPDAVIRQCDIQTSKFGKFQKHVEDNSQTPGIGGHLS